MDDLHTVSQVGGWRSMTYLTTYYRAPPEDKTRALANICKRILLANQRMQEAESDDDD